MVERHSGQGFVSGMTAANVPVLVNVEPDPGQRRLMLDREEASAGGYPGQHNTVKNLTFTDP
jgi:hypothetical protein